MRRAAVLLLALGLVLPFAGTAVADHAAPDFNPLPGLTTGLNQGGIDGVEFEMVESFITGNPHTDIDFFSQAGVTYVSAGTLGIGPNSGGQNIFKLTDDAGNVSADTIEYVAGHPSASCLSDPSAALGLQHDVEATPKGADVPLHGNLTDNEEAVTGDTQLLIDATDGRGRCHDQGTLGVRGVPLGGLEIIDVTDVENPVEIALTSHIGQAHTVNVDPRRPHIAYVVTSDSVSVNADGVRANETTDQNNHDGFEIVDLSSCMTAPFGTMQEGLDVAGKREACQPQVWRYRWPTTAMALGHTNQNAVYACHELEIWPEDKITCGAGAALLLFDMSDVFSAGEDGFERPKVDPLSCSVRETTSTALTSTAAAITDCTVGPAGEDLRIKNWLAMGEPGSIGADIGYLGTAHHQGRQATGGDITSPAYGAAEDIDFNHEAEFTHSRNFVIATDERGGGVVPPGATCAMGLDNPVGNGGLHAYTVDDLFVTDELAAVPEPEEAWTSYAETPDREKAIFRAPINTPGTATECTAHVFQQLPAEGDGTMGRIFMGWYTQGTQVVDYRENADGTFEFAHVGYFIPEHANQWVSHVFSCAVNDDGRISYYGVIADFFVLNGRNAVEVYKATLPPLGAAFDDGAAALTAPPEYCTVASASPGGGAPPPGEAAAPAGERLLPATGADGALLLLAAVLLPLAFGVRVLRRRLSPTA